jgi:hypothetical protein
MQRRLAIVLAVCFLACSPLAVAHGPFPRLLPPPEDFRLTIREEPNSKLPLGPSCSGEALLTLICHAFTVTLENASTRTVHISELRCVEPDIEFEKKEPRSSSGWWIVSRPGQLNCSTFDWINIRLKPGEKTDYTTRLISPPRRSVDSLSGDFLTVGSYELRAHWVLRGCTEAPDGTDCLSPLQVVRGAASIADLDFQEPVTVVSNEITAVNPGLPDLGDLHFDFEVKEASAEMVKSGTENERGCTAPERKAIDCTTFHYTIHNLADRPVRNATASCSDTSIRPEYRFEESAWNSIPDTAWECLRNMLIETEIPAGGTLEGNFTLKTLRPGFDTSALQAPGEYQLRFTFYPSACWASPDASFCLMRPSKQAAVTSKDLTVRNGKP